MKRVRSSEFTYNDITPSLEKTPGLQEIPTAGAKWKRKREGGYEPTSNARGSCAALVSSWLSKRIGGQFVRKVDDFSCRSLLSHRQSGSSALNNSDVQRPSRLSIAQSSYVMAVNKMNRLMDERPQRTATVEPARSSAIGDDLRQRRASANSPAARERSQLLFEREARLAREEEALWDRMNRASQEVLMHRLVGTAMSRELEEDGSSPRDRLLESFQIKVTDVETWRDEPHIALALARIGRIVRGKPAYFHCTLAGEVGHALGIASAGAPQLFDPNHGIFTFESREEMGAWIPAFVLSRYPEFNRFARLFSVGRSEGVSGRATV